jgi:hypothetical protein
MAHHDGVDLAHQLFGSTGEPLLLIMGIGADMLYWHDDLCNALVDNGFQVARFDNRDSGESAHLDWAGTPHRRRLRRDPDTAPYRLALAHSICTHGRHSTNFMTLRAISTRSADPQSADRLVQRHRGLVDRGEVVGVGGLPQLLHGRVRRTGVLHAGSSALPDPIQRRHIGQHQT